LRYHDANNWPLLRIALRRMGRGDLIGSGRHQLIPSYQPAGTGHAPEGTRQGKAFKTQHTGLPQNPPAKPGKHKPRTGARPQRHINPGSPTGAGKRRGPR